MTEEPYFDPPLLPTHMYNRLSIDQLQPLGQFQFLFQLVQSTRDMTGELIIHPSIIHLGGNVRF